MSERILKLEKRKKMHSAVVEQFKISVISIPSFSPCKAACYGDYAKHRDKKLLNECLDDCRAAEAIAAVAERLNRELSDTIIDVIWGGGDIDPLPFEKMVRERFSRLPGER